MRDHLSANGYNSYIKSNKLIHTIQPCTHVSHCFCLCVERGFFLFPLSLSLTHFFFQSVSLCVCVCVICKAVIAFCCAKMTKCSDYYPIEMKNLWPKECESSEWIEPNRVVHSFNMFHRVFIAWAPMLISKFLRVTKARQGCLCECVCNSYASPGCNQTMQILHAARAFALIHCWNLISFRPKCLAAWLWSQCL